MMGDIQPKLEQTAPELEPEYYEENFDPVKAMLMQIPSEGVDIEYFQTQVGRLMLQLDKITESLSKQVMSHHDEMVAGMSLVTELERDLQLTHIICKNGRRYLDAAMREVSQDLVVTANVKRKQILLDMLPILMRMQSVSEIKSQLESTVQQGNYAKALRMCSECLLLMEDNPELKAFGDLTQGIEEWLQRTVEKVDEVLRDNCRKFDTKSYAMVIDGYAVMGDAMGLADKVQSFFAQSIVLMTHDVLKSFAVQTIESNKDPQAVAKKVRLPYNDLCLQLPEMLFRQCLHKMLEVIFDLLCSYYTMMVFEHPEPVPENKFLSTVEESGGGGSRHRRALSIGGTGNTSPSRDQLASTAGGLSPSSSFENFRSAAGRPSSPLRRPLSPVNDKLSGVGSTSGRGRQGKAADGGSPRRGSSYDLIGAERGGFLVMRSDEDSNLAGRALDWSDAGLFGDRESVARVRKETTSTVRKALEKGRKTVWELAARRVSSLLASDAICSASPHHFLQSLELTNKFILAGEAFSGAEAVQLRARLAKQSERYFRTFHRQNLEVLRMMLDKELWQGLPSSALKTVNLAALTGNGVSASSPSSMGQADRSSGELAASNNADQAQRDGALSTSRHREDASRAAALDGGEATTSGRGSFADWVAGGNPFVDKRASAPSPSPSSPVGADGGKSSSAGSPTGQPGSAGEETETSGSPREISIGQANGNVASSNGQDASRLTSMNGEGDEEEEENEELMADFIDEESQKPKLRRMSRGRGGEQRGNFSEGERGPMLTASAISVLSVCYGLGVDGDEAQGLSQLFEVYLFTVFKVFGQKELLFPQNRLNDASTSGRTECGN
ncbi:hypothetical protein CBR_g49688 [Chara braunii]|uniref:Vacuolar protein sorting-associated protein 54 N-terminal domain-containing protein n=1 Tax=Chara braunii TaxID=69332 RepID=A0A388M5T0_CHABU|nr:hypothetical protein CBR_g49688 [Chara braunii]|eukprot:GBG89839.1 hypothetical protein CBR_g49688 [Chara braunii]